MSSAEQTLLSSLSILGNVLGRTPSSRKGFELLQTAAITSEGSCVQATIVIHAVKSLDEW